jgi:hypothetical protein
MILSLAGDREFEFQRLHGMGHILYAQLKTRLQKQGKNAGGARVRPRRQP